jgi:hypothetical protein
MANQRTDTAKPRESKIVEWYGRLEDAPLFPDLEYWQSQPDIAKFQAVHDMIIEAHLIKGEDLRGARLQRAVEHFERRRR